MQIINWIDDESFVRSRIIHHPNHSLPLQELAVAIHSDSKNQQTSLWSDVQWNRISPVLLEMEVKLLRSESESNSDSVKASKEDSILILSKDNRRNDLRSVTHPTLAARITMRETPPNRQQPHRRVLARCLFYPTTLRKPLTCLCTLKHMICATWCSNSTFPKSFDFIILEQERHSDVSKNLNLFYLYQTALRFCSATELHSMTRGLIGSVLIPTPRPPVDPFLAWARDRGPLGKRYSLERIAQAVNPITSRTNPCNGTWHTPNANTAWVPGLPARN